MCSHAAGGHERGWPAREAPCTVLVRQPDGRLKRCECPDYRAAYTRVITRRRASVRLARWLLGLRP